MISIKQKLICPSSKTGALFLRLSTRRAPQKLRREEITITNPLIAIKISTPAAPLVHSPREAWIEEAVTFQSGSADLSEKGTDLLAQPL